jgi:hypothetical protein
MIHEKSLYVKKLLQGMRMEASKENGSEGGMAYITAEM